MKQASIVDDENSRLLQKYLTYDEATVIAQTISQRSVTSALDALSASLQEYHRIVRHVIQQSSIPGVEQYELIAFKEDYGPTAFVCEWPGCDNIIRGFSSEADLASHQARHTQSLRCYEKDCPRNDVGFTTRISLKQHKRKMHPDLNMEPIPKRFHNKKSPMTHIPPGDMVSARGAQPNPAAFMAGMHPNQYGQVMQQMNPQLFHQQQQAQHQAQLMAAQNPALAAQMRQQQMMNQQRQQQILAQQQGIYGSMAGNGMP
ncbi:hypothetical protein E8E14_001163, partial [Neopestalotiopsis sp. 37M]